MKRSKVILLGVMISGIALSFTAKAQQMTSEDREAYVKMEEEKRKKKDELFKTGSTSTKNPHNHSPLSKEQKDKFKGLSYFPVDLKYKVRVEYTRLKNAVPFPMTFTDGSTRQYVEHGIAKFTIDGVEYKLYAFQDVAYQTSQGGEFKDYLFIPFKDETNGETTFGGGRYIQWHVPEGKFDEIDFNNAFNPYCVYNPKTKCPIPPEVNHLKVKIEAGEKDFEL
jgi:uncharacterized protein